MLHFIPLEYYAYANLVNFISASAIAAILLYKNKDSKIKLIFGLFSVAVAFWSLFYFIFLETDTKQLADFFLRTCMIGVLFMPSLFIHFVIELLDIKDKKRFITMNYGISLALLLCVYTPLYSRAG